MVTEGMCLSTGPMVTEGVYLRTCPHGYRGCVPMYLSLWLQRVCAYVPVPWLQRGCAYVIVPMVTEGVCLRTCPHGYRGVCYVPVPMVTEGGAYVPGAASPHGWDVRSGQSTTPTETSLKFASRPSCNTECIENQYTHSHHQITTSTQLTKGEGLKLKKKRDGLRLTKGGGAKGFPPSPLLPTQPPTP